MLKPTQNTMSTSLAMTSLTVWEYHKVLTVLHWDPFCGSILTYFVQSLHQGAPGGAELWGRHPPLNHSHFPLGGGVVVYLNCVHHTVRQAQVYSQHVPLSHHWLQSSQDLYQLHGKEEICRYREKTLLVEIEVYSDGKSLRLLKLVFFTYKLRCRYITN